MESVDCKKAYHLDIFRLSAKETDVLELKRIFKEKNSIVLIEWAEKIKKQLPQNTLWIYLKHGKKSNERTIIINFPVPLVFNKKHGSLA